MRNLSGNATRYLRGALLALCCLSNAVQAALPSGGQVVEGTGHYSQTDTRLDIVQESQYMVIEWADFSVGASETVSISQPSADSAVLIRVLSETQAEIAGKLQSNGRVVIVDGAGIIFAASAEVTVGGLAASTLQISDMDFMAGQMKFSGSSTGGVANFGQITVAAGGEVEIVARKIVVDGAIVAPAGGVNLIAGTPVNLTVRDHPIVGEWFDDSIIGLRGLVSAQSGRVQLYASRIDATGQFDVQGGTLLLDPDEIWIGTSTANVSTGADSGAGTLSTCSGGNITFAGGTTAAGTLTFGGAITTLGATINGTGNLTVNGGTILVGGTINSTAATPIGSDSSAATLSINGDNMTIAGGTTGTLAADVAIGTLVGDATLAGAVNLTTTAASGSVTIMASGRFDTTAAPSAPSVVASASGATLNASSPTLQIMNWGPVSSWPLVSGSNSYVLSAAGVVFGTSAIVATEGLSSGGTAVNLASLSISSNQQVAAGWNLLGNGTDAPLDVAAAFGDATRVNTVWKWNAATVKWAFYAPSMSAQALADYAAGKGYEVLASIAGGEGFWVNAQAPFVYALPIANLLPVASVQAQLPSGWSLVAVGEETPPSVFGAALGQAAADGASLWAWDKDQAKWYFHAPSLEAQGGTALADYAAGKGYIDFKAANKSLGVGMGFWVRKP